MANYNFRKDLKIGQKGEEVVKTFLESKGASFVNFNDNNQYDLKMMLNEEEITYEIKTDVFCSPEYDTGNLFIEFFSRDKESGISTSKAKWFVNYYKFLNEMWFIKTEDLRQLIIKNNFKVKVGGDVGSQTHGYLIPRNEFKEHFKIYKL